MDSTLLLTRWRERMFALMRLRGALLRVLIQLAEESCTVCRRLESEKQNGSSKTVRPSSRNSLRKSKAG
jgi:hypothetical protein